MFGCRKLRGLETMTIDAQLLYFGFEGLPGNAKFGCCAGWSGNESMSFTKGILNHVSFLLNEIREHGNSRHCGFRRYRQQPRFINDKSLAIQQDYRALNHV